MWEPEVVMCVSRRPLLSSRARRKARPTWRTPTASSELMAISTSCEGREKLHPMLARLGGWFCISPFSCPFLLALGREQRTRQQVCVSCLLLGRVMAGQRGGDDSCSKKDCGCVTTGRRETGVPLECRRRRRLSPPSSRRSAWSYGDKNLTSEPPPPIQLNVELFL